MDWIEIVFFIDFFYFHFPNQNENLLIYFFGPWPCFIKLFCFQKNKRRIKNQWFVCPKIMNFYAWLNIKKRTKRINILKIFRQNIWFEFIFFIYFSMLFFIFQPKWKSSHQFFENFCVTTCLVKLFWLSKNFLEFGFLLFFWKSKLFYKNKIMVQNFS